MGKCETPTFKLNLWLKPNKQQIAILEKKFRLYTNLYNSFNNVLFKRYNRLFEDRNNHYIKARYFVKNRKKEDAKKYSELLKENGFTQYGIEKLLKEHKFFINELNISCINDMIFNRLWKSWEEFLYKNHKISYKKGDDINSITGSHTNSVLNGIDIDTENKYILYKKANKGLNKKKEVLAIKYKINNNDYYAKECLSEYKIKFISIKRVFINGKYKYQAQLSLEGYPPIKYSKETGEIKRQVGSGDVGLDIGTRTIAISSKNQVNLIELADKINNNEKEIRVLQRKLDRSKRSTNTNNYNEDGTIKNGIYNDGKRVRLKWVFSNNYKEIRSKLKSLYSKTAYLRKQQHEELANYIMSLGDKIYVEKMSFKGLQRKAKKTEKNKKGKFKKKKRFGKSLMNKAPAMLLEILKRKLKYYGLELNFVNTQKLKASQYNQFTDDYKKKTLNQRNNKKLDGINNIQRDLYSAYLIQNVNNDLETFNTKKLTKNFNNFLQLHNIEIERIKNGNNKILHQEIGFKPKKVA